MKVIRLALLTVAALLLSIGAFAQTLEYSVCGEDYTVECDDSCVIMGYRCTGASDCSWWNCEGYCDLCEDG